MDMLSSEYEFRVRWEPYLLRPQTPPEGLPIPASYKDPNNPRAQMVRNVGKSLGLEFSTTRERFASTLKGHALLEFAKESAEEKQDSVAEKLFKKCFTDGDLLQDAALLEVAQECGLDQEQAKSYISDKNKLENVYEKALSWAQKGISGVPTFYMNGQKMFSGAQEPETFKRMFEIAAEKFPISKS